MTDRLTAFYEKFSADEDMQQELVELLKDTKPEDQIPITINYAKEKGFELTEEDFAIDDEDANIEELETVAGGGGCGCAALGGGTGDGLMCDCILMGRGYVQGYTRVSSQGGCICISCGAGATRRH